MICSVEIMPVTSHMGISPISSMIYLSSSETLYWDMDGIPRELCGLHCSSIQKHMAKGGFTNARAYDERARQPLRPDPGRRATPANVALSAAVRNVGNCRRDRGYMRHSALFSACTFV